MCAPITAAMSTIQATDPIRAFFHHTMAASSRNSLITMILLREMAALQQAM
jgi:hypothetical protein